MTVFRYAQRRKLHEYIDRWFDRTMTPLEVHRYEAPRSGEQQRYIHVLFQAIASGCGCSMEWVKQELIKNDVEGIYPHWPRVEHMTRHGDVVLMPKSESRLTKREETEQIERLHALMAEWGIELPPMTGEQSTGTMGG